VEFRAQLFFAPSHLSIVALVIVAPQMQDAVQHENLNFLGGRVSERARILRCDLRRNGDFARELFSGVGLGGKRKHVGLSFPRKRRFRDFSSAFEVTSTLTTPFNPAARRARATKRSSANSVRSATRF